DAFFLTINFLELAFDIKTKNLIDAFGFFPLINANKIHIELPPYENGDFTIRLHDENIISGAIYDYEKKAHSNEKGLMGTKIYYDEASKVICLGEIDFRHKSIKINNNIICTLDQEDILRCLYILIDEFK
ncbi:MAG: hypothetical protein IJV62_03245, partial [Eggerthellaceae bacterium]|nr:hypothetical protein [Eggerthellaceae bacterium]